MLKEVSRLLARVGVSGSFASRRTAAASDLKLEVQGVGRIRFPIAAAVARKLCAAARPARHGFKDLTRLDRRVRDTWEIPRRRISIDQPRWQKTLAPQLDRIRRDLGLPEGCRIQAQLHNLLVYAPGQFFVTHQDSEKADDMIGTLVVSLPSQFTGGAMVIEHHDETLRVGGSDKQLTFIAFYADCRHEVRPIKQGHRVVLTYNLILAGDAAARAPADRVEALTRHIRKFFETSRAPRWKGDRESGTPDRLVYLLDHQYTRQGLAWNRLKSADAQRAALLQEAARQLDCEIFLALADVHETWMCEDGYSDDGRRWRYDSYDEEEEEEDEPKDESSEPELIELIDSDVELRHWVCPGGRPKAMAGAGVGDHELCYTKPSVELEPFESEHQGYTGNEGSTVDRWYHRAAVVLWPRDRTFVIRAKASPRWAIAEIARTLKAGNVAAAVTLARRLSPFWAQAAAGEKKGGFLEATLRVAAKVDDPKVAAMLIGPFTLSAVTPKAAPRLADLVERYGMEWSRTLLRQWSSQQENHEAPEGRLAWISSALPAFCRSLCARNSSEGQALARWMLSEQWASVLTHLEQLREHGEAREWVKASSRVCKPMLALIESSRIAEHPPFHREVIEFLTAGTADLPAQVQLGVLRAAHQRRRPEALHRLGLKPVHASCAQKLTAQLDAPARAKDNWSIATPVRCSCRLCATLTRYLRAADKLRLEWPLAKEQRAHIHGIIEDHDLPVRHTTRRTGRPFTLLLEKTAAVFARDATERRFWQSEVEWLTKTAGDF